MTARGTLRARWVRVVYRTTVVSATVRVTMLALADHMREDGYVSVPLAVMADRLDRHPRKVLAHYHAAIAAGLLDRVSRGYEGHTAEYRAVLPGPERVPIPSTLSDGQRVPKTDTLSRSEIGTLLTPERVPTIGTPVLSAGHPDRATDSYAVGHDEERSDEQTPRTEDPLSPHRQRSSSIPPTHHLTMTTARPRQRTAAGLAHVGDALPTTSEDDHP